MAKKETKVTKKRAKTSNSFANSEFVKKFKQNPGLYIGSVVILIVITVVFLAGDLITPNTGTWDNTFGYYDGVPIRWVPDNIFDQYRRNAIQYYQSQGVDFSNPWMVSQAWQMAFEATVLHTAILQMMKRSGYELPVKLVDREVARHPDLQENGRFSAVLYNQMSESSRLLLWRQVQEDMLKKLYFSDFFDGLMLTNTEAEFIGKMASPQRTFEMVSFSIDSFPDSEYLNYARENASLFDSIHLSRISINSGEREAVRVLDTIKSGTITFEDAARTQSQDGFADRGGDMGVRYVYDLEREIPSLLDRTSIINLRRGDLSPVIRIGESWVIYRAEDDLIKANFNDDSIMDRVRSYLRNFDRGRMEDWAIEQAREFIKAVNETNFEEAALEHSMEIYNFGPVPLNYGGVELFTGIQSSPIPGFSEQDLTDFARNENFWRTAFGTGLNTPSEPFVQGNRILVLLPAEEINVEDSAAMDAASMYLSYWLNMVTEQSMQHYFVKNPRMDDQFIETFFREMMP